MGNEQVRLQILLPIASLLCIVSILVNGAVTQEINLQISQFNNPPPLSELYNKQVAAIDQGVFQILKKWQENEILTGSEPLSLLQNLTAGYVDDYEINAGGEYREYILNPISVLTIIFRLVIDLSMIEEALQPFKQNDMDNKETLLLQELDAAKTGNLLPTVSILNEAIERLLRITHTYDLPVAEVATGKFRGIVTGSRLSQRHCIQIAKYAPSRLYYALAVEFANYGKNFLPFDNFVKESDIHRILETAILKHDRAYDDDIWQENFPFTFFTTKISPKVNNVEEKLLVIQRQRTVYAKEDQISKMPELLKKYATCTGQNLQTEVDKRELYCWYERHLHPEFQLNPLKIELHSKVPLLIQAYDLVTSKEVDELKVLAEPRLQKANVLNFNTGEVGPTNKRTSFSTYLPWDSPCVACHHLKRKISRFTGLQINEAATTEFQIASYTYGGHYVIHQDSISKELAEKLSPEGKNRLATFMAYLTDVEGGMTSFPHIGVAVKPVARSGLFWYNLDEDENLIENMRHGACPVILGGPKWIANLWIKVREQFSNWKCKPKS